MTTLGWFTSFWTLIKPADNHFLVDLCHVRQYLTYWSIDQKYFPVGVPRVGARLVSVEHVNAADQKDTHCVSTDLLEAALEPTELSVDGYLHEIIVVDRFSISDSQSHVVMDDFFHCTTARHFWEMLQPIFHWQQYQTVTSLVDAKISRFERPGVDSSSPPKPSRGPTHLEAAGLRQSQRPSATNRMGFRRSLTKPHLCSPWASQQISTNTGIAGSTLRRWRNKLQLNQNWRPTREAYYHPRWILTDDEEAQLLSEVKANYINKGLYYSDQNFNTDALRFWESPSAALETNLLANANVPDLHENRTLLCSALFIQAFRGRHRMSRRRPNLKQGPKASEEQVQLFIERIQALI
jgi:hypothetical protein